MKFFVRTKPGAKKNAVEKLDESRLIVSVKARAEGGKANEEVEELLAKHFGAPKSCVRITHGRKSRQKIVEVII